jgi:ubiquinone/menaquinone biosynthesis C-methylase UbiE
MDQQERKAMIKETFNTVAPGYDHPALRFFPDSAEHLADSLALRGDERVLDVATGTGSAALALSRRLPRGRITAVDFSPAMLAQAAAKAAARGADNIRFVEMDMQSLAFPSADFDAATCAFGIFFVEDMTEQLRHISDRVRPGGRIAVCSFYQDAFLPLSDLFLARMAQYGIEAPPLSWKRIADEDRAKALFAGAGLERIRVQRNNVGYYLRDAGEWWQVIWNAGFRGLVNRLAPDARERFRQEHLAEIQSLSRAEGLWLEVNVLYAVGIRPALRP